MPTRFRHPISLLLSSTTLLFGLGLPLQASSAQPVPGGTLTLAMSYDLGCIDAQQNTLQAVSAVGNAITDSLLDQNLTTGEVVPYLAERWEVSPDSRSYTFHLRKGVTFSDGTTLDGNVVKANLDEVIKLGARSVIGTRYLTGYTGTTLIDDYTVRVDFDTPNAVFLLGIASPSLGIYALSTLGKTPDDRCQGQIVGSGAYTLDAYNRNSEAVLKKRAGYDWASPANTHQGEAYIDTVRIPIVPEASVRTGGLLSGEFDAVFLPSALDQDRIEAAGNKVEVRAVPGANVALYANLERPIGSETAIRQALQSAFDRLDLRDVLQNKRYPEATSIITNAVLGYVDLSDKLKLDLDRSKKLLDDAGWVQGTDTYRKRDGKELELVIRGWSGWKRELELVQSVLKDLGIKVSFIINELPEEAKYIAAGEWDFNLFSRSGTDPDVLRGAFWSGARPQSSARIPPNPLDDVLVQQLGAGDPEKRAELIRQAQHVIIDEALAIPLRNNAYSLGSRPHVQDFHLDAASRFRFYNAWIKQ